MAGYRRRRRRSSWSRGRDSYGRSSSYRPSRNYSSSYSRDSHNSYSNGGSSNGRDRRRRRRRNSGWYSGRDWKGDKRAHARAAATGWRKVAKKSWKPKNPKFRGKLYLKEVAPGRKSAKKRSSTKGKNSRSRSSASSKRRRSSGRSRRRG